jgi:ribonucleoside-diphosphate reductase alpha chain
MILMCGAGVGFSVERQYVEKLPPVKHQRNVPVSTMTIRDSKGGWQEALNAGLALWWEGRDIIFDFSDIRPEGAPLKKMGGRASGPEVLRKMLDVTRSIILSAAGRKLTSLECHDICCHIARCVVVGGVRRSAMISLSDIDDQEMRDCKIGVFPPERFGANNSAVYRDKPSDLDFLQDFAILGKSGTGERGFFNLGAARKNAPHRRKSKNIAITNPCAEVTLRNREFCNLSTYVIRPDDDFYRITDKATTAAWIGVLQSTFTDFPYLSPEWETNCIEERLCGVSPTGVLDNLARLDPKELELTKKQIVRTVRHAAEVLGINVPAAATCVKPNGTVSALVDSAAGLHPRWAQYFVRNIQISVNDPLFKLMADQGVPHMITPDDPYTAIVSFPRSSPEGAVVRHDLSAIEQLNTYKCISQNYCEMNASCTIYVSPNEWIQVAHWVYENWDAVNGLSFFPRGDHAYKWAPYEDIIKEEYERLSESFPQLDFSRLPDYEHNDQTTGSKEYACTAGGCEI